MMQSGAHSEAAEADQTAASSLSLKTLAARLPVGRESYRPAGSRLKEATWPPKGL